MLKKYRVFAYPLIIACGISFILFFYYKIHLARRAEQISMSEKWTVKETESISRLLQVPIILYHDVDGKGPFSVTKETLHTHFEMFRSKGYTVVPLKDLIERFKDPQPFSEKSIVITFDDGYKNMYVKLLPLVREFKYPVTLFVYTDFVYSKSTKSITWDELNEMQNDGIDIQSHTMSHPDLPALSKEISPESKEKLYRELYLSRILLEAKLNKTVDLLAYPFGRYDLDTIQLARYAGYTRVFSTDDGSNFVSYNNYCLRRHHIKRSYSLKMVESIIE